MRRTKEALVIGYGHPSYPEKVEGKDFNGQIFDAHALVADLIRQAKSRIVVIDNYIDESVLVQLSKRQPGVTVDIYDVRFQNNCIRMFISIMSNIPV